MGTALAFALQLLAAIPQLIAAGVEVSGLVQKYRDRVQDMNDSGRDPTPEEWDELNAEIARLNERLSC